MIDKSEIARLIPHAGNMCLLDRVEAWDKKSIICVAISHRDKRNPLANDGVLPALCGIEYAAQAMAIHGALDGAIKGRPRAGYLASVRAVKVLATRLDDLPGDLTIAADRLMGDAGQVIYNFRLAADGREVLRGRAAVILEIEPE